MALPSILDSARQYLFADVDRMAAAGVPATTINHLLRLRDIYNYWLNFPAKRDRDIVAELRARYGIGDTTARDDLKLIKILLGDLQKPTKDYMRYRTTVMLERAYKRLMTQMMPAIWWLPPLSLQRYIVFMKRMSARMFLIRLFRHVFSLPTIRRLSVLSVCLISGNTSPR